MHGDILSSHGNRASRIDGPSCPISFQRPDHAAVRALLHKFRAEVHVASADSWALTAPAGVVQI